MSKTLYRKYRPKNFSEVIGQSHIVRTLSNSIKNNRPGQAYLFAGPRGTGKTSVARILAKTLNCENLKNTLPCEKCKACKNINAGKSLDIIEIDAASNTGVDNIRELKETVSLSPNFLRYKVYIIDEVHMLSSGAFNALLKTLEEPPLHVVFILATTEIHKIPETVISRCQKFDFTRLPLPNIIEKLSLIAKGEKVKIEREALEMIALYAEGGMRDAESTLEKIISLEDKTITAKEVEEILGIAEKEMVFELTEKIIEKNSGAAIEKINELFEEGFDLQIFNKSLINYLRQLMLIKTDPKLKKYLSHELPEEQLKKMKDLTGKTDLREIIMIINLFLEAQNKITASIWPPLPLEIAVIKATQKFPSGKEMAEETEFLENNIPPEKKSTNEEEKESSAPETEGDFSKIDCVFIKKNWKKILIDIRPFNHSLSALLSNCEPTKTEGNIVTLATAYNFYGEKLNETENKLTIEKVFARVLGCAIKIKVLVDKSLATIEKSEPKTENKSKQNSLLNSALEIMGGKIVE